MKDIEYEYRAINLFKDGGEQFSDEFIKMNPLQQVPALVVDDGQRKEVLVQSLAIVEYLEEVYPEPRLLPADPVQRAKARAIAETISGGIQPLQNLETTRVVEKFGGNSLEWRRHFIGLKLGQLELILSQTAGLCCIGDEVTIADLCLVPQVYNALHFGVDMTKFTLINKLYAHLLELPAFKASRPDNQPDSSDQVYGEHGY